MRCIYICLQRIPLSRISVPLINSSTHTLKSATLPPSKVNYTNTQLTLHVDRIHSAPRCNHIQASMASHGPTSFQPTTPIRTSTVDSQKSTDSSGQPSPTSAPASPTSRAFFGAITERLRERSRSRPRTDTSRKRAKSPMMMPPEQLPAQSQPARRAPQLAAPEAPAKATRPALQQEQRRSTSSSSSSDPWRGRHSNEWLFGGFSVRDTAKGYLERRKS